MSHSQSSTENRSSPLFMSDRGTDMNMEDTQSQDLATSVKRERIEDEDLNVSYLSRVACPTVS